MRNITSALLAAITGARQNGITPRTLVYVTAKNRTTGLPESVGVWSDHDDSNIPVISGITGLQETRLYYGGGALVQVSDIPRVSDLTVQTLTVDLSQIDRKSVV